MATNYTPAPKVDYGIDAPGVVRNLLVLGALAIALGLLNRLFPPAVASIARSVAGSGVFCLATGLTMLWGSKVGKFRLRDKVLSRIVWLGNEQVLDVGCGHGLMLIGAAKRLTTGKSVGVDLWQSEDQANNSAEATLQNAQLEGVADKVVIQTGDARELPFADGSFDVVLSSFALHNLYKPADRARALAEIARVLRPGGQLALIDIRHSKRYADALRDKGLASVHVSWPNFLFVTPTRTVTARKPLSA